MLIGAVGAVSYTQNVKTAYAYATNSETIDFGSDGITSADATVEKELITLLGASSYDDLSSKLTAPKKASEFASAKTVTLGGVTFNIMYVSKADYAANGTEIGDVIVTLWMAENDFENMITSQYSYPDGRDNTDDTYPTHMYSSSYIRSTLVGTDYLKVVGEQTLSGTDGAVNDAWKPFNVGGTFYKYLATPANMAWQETISAVGISGDRYNFPNEAWGTPSEGSFASYPGNYDFDYSEKIGYFDWKNDRIWLPALTEVRSGALWATSSKQSDNIVATWLRSGYDDYADKAYYLNATGDFANDATNLALSVRPALHLNLKSIDEAANPKPYEVTAGTTITKYLTLEEAWTAANSAGTATVKMLADAEVSSTLEVSAGKNITLDLNGKKLAYTGESGSVISVDGKFTLEDKGTATHVVSNHVTNEVVEVSGGLITGGKGAVVSGTVLGGAVYVTGTGEFTMNGGMLADNTARIGGGVYNSGTLTMTGGRITCNTAGDGLGGGVYNNGTFKVSGKPEITGNTANGSECNVTLNQKITLAGELTEGAKIGVGTGTVANGYTQSDKPGKYFIPDDAANDCVYAKDGSVGIDKHKGGTATCANKAVCVNCSEEYGEVIAEHNYGEWTVTLEPTCMAVGSKKHTCAVCNHEETEEIAINETSHDWNDGEITTQPTCTGNGVKTFTCSHNSTHTRTESIDALGHSFGEWIAEIAATATENGAKGHKDCSVCNKHFDAENNEITDLVIPAAGVGITQVLIKVEGGAIDGTEENSVTVNANGEVTVIANEQDGKTFKGWSADGGKTILCEDARYTFTATENLSLVAVYEDNTPVPEQSKGLSGGAIAGISVGAALLILLAAYIAFYFALYRRGVLLKGKVFDIIYMPMNAIFKKKEKNE